MYLDSDLTSSVGFRISIIFGYVIDFDYNLCT